MVFLRGKIIYSLVLVNTLFSQIPIALAVGFLLAAVAGAILNAPVSLILIAAGTVAIATVALVPVCIAVVTSHMTLAILRYYMVGEEKLKVQQPD
jgi:hypothetical protein